MNVLYTPNKKSWTRNGLFIKGGANREGVPYGSVVWINVEEGRIGSNEMAIALLEALFQGIIHED